jgi:hypothetical protein
MKKQEMIDKTKFPYEIGTRVSVKSPYIKKLATIVGISYNSCACMQYEIKFDGEDVVIHYPTDLMILATTETMEDKYPSSYEECCFILNEYSNQPNITGYKYELLDNFRKLIICLNAYWKIAGKQMGLDAPWKPDWNDEKQDKYGLYNEVKYTIINPAIFVFPTEEMRDAFYENFKNLIKKCKKFL